MSAGNYLGAGLASLLSIGVWWVFGKALDKVGAIFNKTLTVIPSFQDAANGFTFTQQVYLLSIVVVLICIWVNCALNESSEASGVI